MDASPQIPTMGLTYQDLHPLQSKVSKTVAQILSPQSPLGGHLRPLAAPGSNTTSLMSLPTPQLGNTYSPSIASVDITRTPYHAHERLPPQDHRDSLKLEFGYDMGSQLDHPAFPQAQDSGDSVQVPGAFPKEKKESVGLPTTMDGRLFMRARALTPHSMPPQSPLSSKESSPLRTAPPSAFHRRFPSHTINKTARPPSPIVRPRSSPSLPPPSPVASLRPVTLQHPKPVHPVEMKAVDDAASIISVLESLAVPSPYAAQSFASQQLSGASAVASPSHSAGLVPPSPYSMAHSDMSWPRGSPAVFAGTDGLELGGPTQMDDGPTSLDTQNDPPIPSAGGRPVPKKGRTIGRGRPVALAPSAPAPNPTSNWAVFPSSSPFLGASPLPSAALNVSLPASPMVNTLATEDPLEYENPPVIPGLLGEEELQPQWGAITEAGIAVLDPFGILAPATATHQPPPEQQQSAQITSAHLPAEQQQEHRVRWQALADRRAQAPLVSFFPAPANDETDERAQWTAPNAPALRQYSLPSTRRTGTQTQSSGSSFYKFLPDEPLYASPDHIPGYRSPPKNERIVCGLQQAYEKGRRTTGIDPIACPSLATTAAEGLGLKWDVERSQWVETGTPFESNRPAGNTVQEVMMRQIIDIASQIEGMDGKLYAMAKVMDWQTQYMLNTQPAPKSQPELNVADSHCVILEHSGVKRTSNDVRVCYSMAAFSKLAKALGRDFWLGGAKDATSMENRYMPTLRLVKLEDQEVEVGFNCEGMLAHTPLKFVLVEEVLDFMRQMLTALDKLHTKGVYHGSIGSYSIGVYGTEMLQRTYVLFPCARKTELSAEEGYSQDMYQLGEIFIDLLHQSSIFTVFDELLDWMTGITKPQQLAPSTALRLLDALVVKEEVLKHSYMTIYRPGREPDLDMECDKIVLEVEASEESEEEESEIDGDEDKAAIQVQSVDGPMSDLSPQTRPRIPGSNDCICGSPVVFAEIRSEPSLPSMDIFVGRRTNTNLTTNTDGHQNQIAEVVVVDETSFVMSPASPKAIDLPKPKRRGWRASTRKALGKMKRWLKPQW